MKLFKIIKEVANTKATEDEIEMTIVQALAKTLSREEFVETMTTLYSVQFEKLLEQNELIKYLLLAIYRLSLAYKWHEKILSRT